MADILPLLGNARPHRTLRNRVAEWLSRKPMHDLDQIDDLFLGFGIKNLTKNAAKKDGASTIRSKVVGAVERRHYVAHYGDYHSGKNSLKPIGRKRTENQLGWISRLVDQSDILINSVTNKV